MNNKLWSRAVLALLVGVLTLGADRSTHRASAQESSGVSESGTEAIAEVADVETDVVEDETMGGGDLDAPSRTALSEEFQDASFARYVDLRLVGDAVDARDAALLTDVALQLAEGERILLRNHKSGLTAKKLMGKAAKLAGDNQDKASLERLAKAAAATKDNDLIAAIQAGQKLAGATRATDPGLSVSLETTNIDTLTNMMGWINAVRNADLLGDKAELQLLHKEIGQAEGLSEAQRAAIAKHIDQATASVVEADEQDPVMIKLAGESRGWAQEAGGKISGAAKNPGGTISNAWKEINRETSRWPGGAKNWAASLGISPTVVPVYTGSFSYYGFTLFIFDRVDLSTGTYLHSGRLFYGLVDLGSTEKRGKVRVGGSAVKVDMDHKYKLSKKGRDLSNKKCIAYEVHAVINFKNLRKSTCRVDHFVAK